jgi:ABC-2 type transport system permease protein
VFLLAGQIAPVALLPGPLAALATALPFRYMLGFPVEMMIGKALRADVLHGLAIQWSMVLVLATLAAVAWRAGLRRFEAYGA